VPLIEVADGWLLDVLLAETAPNLLVRLDDRVAAIAPAYLDALLARLRQLGHTPKILTE
jgi:hypothetical protein